MKPAICTQCGGQIQVDETKEAGICQHCGTAFITEKVINNYTTQYNTVHNVTENVTKIIYGNEKDEGEDFAKRGLTNLKLENWDEAGDDFEKAIKLSPEKAKYRFYLAWADTYGGKLVHSSWPYTDRFLRYEDLKGKGEILELTQTMQYFFKLATDKEKAELTAEYGYNLTDEKTFLQSIAFKCLELPDECGNYNVAWAIMRKAAKEGWAEPIALKLQDYLIANPTYNPQNSGTWYLWGWVMDNLPAEKLILKNSVENGVYTILEVDSLPSNNGVFTVPKNVKKVIFANNEKLFKKAKAKFKKAVVTPNLESLGMEFDVIEYAPGFDRNKVRGCFSAKYAYVFPEGTAQIGYFENKIICCKTTFDNIPASSDYNFYGMVTTTWHSSGAVMGNAVFYPMKKRGSDKWEIEEKEKFEENLKKAFGPTFLLDKTLMAVPPQKQYKKALKINKKASKKK